MSATGEHKWFRDALADHLLELLVQEDEARFRAHALECTACGAMLAVALVHRGDWWEATGHLHATLLRGLADGSVELPGSAPAVVRAHLSNCEACQNELTSLSGRTEGDSVAKPAHGPRARLESRAASWAWGVLGAIAGAAAVLIMVLPQSGAPPSPPLGPVAAMPSEPARVRIASPALVRITSPTRSTGEADTTSVEFSLAEPLVAFSLPPTLGAPTAACDVDLFDSQGRSLAHLTTDAANLQRDGGLVLDLREVEPGPYLLVIRWSERGGSHERRYPLFVSVRE